MSPELPQEITEKASPFLNFLRSVDKVGEWAGKIFAWAVIPMAFCIGFEVIARYVFNNPTIWVYDTTWMLYGTHFMMGGAYTLMKKGHIRTDLLYMNWSIRTQAWVDILSYIIFFFPGMILFFIACFDRASLAWSIREVSNATPWRPPIYPVITVMPVSIGLLLIQGACDVLKRIYTIVKGYEV